VAFSSPRPIRADDDLSSFDCGQELLNDWLRQQALKSEGNSARSYVLRDGRRVVGYYCLATGAAARASVPRKLRHDLPDPVPAMILGRLAIDKDYQRKGIGSALLKDALQRCLQVSGQVGVRAVLVHAIDDAARNFYAAYGFIEFPAGTRTLCLPMELVSKAL
jgi:GNAT superfamily N-acetyltransferase